MTRSTFRRDLVFASLLLLVAAGARAAEQLVAPTGTLRAVYIVANLAQALRDPATGTVSGVAADLTRELARRAGVPSTITPLATASDVLQAVRSGSADIAFVATRNVTGLRMLPDNFCGVPQTIAVPRDRADRLRWIDAALDDLRASGFVADAVSRSGVDGLEAARPEASRPSCG